MAPLLELRGVGKFLDNSGWVLRNVDLRIEQGEFVCIVGASGVGKTTLLRIIGALEQASEGEVCLNGRPHNRPSQAVGYVFQEGALLPWRTALQNVTFGLQLRGKPSAERTLMAQETLKLVGLSGYEESYPYELSGGMRQRVGIARALAIQPDILLMDEPFNSLDVTLRKQLQQETLRIWQRLRPAVFFVTHDLREAVAMSTRVIVLDGRPAAVVADKEVPEDSSKRKDLETELLGIIDDSSVQAGVDLEL